MNPSQNLLIELGVEELPSDAMDVVYQDLAKKISDVFSAERIAFSCAKVEATPRRIAIFIEGVASKQQDQTNEFSGPSYEKAYEQDGKPTQALLGFLRSKSCEVSDIQIKDTPKGKFVTVQKSEKGKSTLSVLPGMIQKVFTSVNFPKNMRWEASGFKFPRPIRWLVVLLDKKVIRVSLAGIQSSNMSYGHRFLTAKPFRILSADWALYQKTLKKNHVILCQKDREEIIREGLKNQFDQPKADEDLIHLTAQLAEEPYLLKGGFAKDYLALPSEVLASCMKKNQKIFACYDKNGKANGSFVAVLNGKRAGLPKIRSDFENVLESRLRDAKYFYELDTKEAFEKKLPLVEQIVYLGKLGTMKDKTERMEKLADHFATALKLSGDEHQNLKRAARLSKIDLMSRMVYEFPDLQGIMGGYYAKVSGENNEVALALRSQYLPKNLSENYRDVKNQMSKLSALFGIVDRLDFLVGAFGIGQIPTGSQDPYAIRRAAGIFVKLIRSFGIHFSMEAAVDAAVSAFHIKLDLSTDQLKEKLISQFLKERIAFELQAAAGTRSVEIFQAVWNASRYGKNLDIADLFERFEILNEIWQKNPQVFVKAAKVVERTSNILKGSKQSDFNLNGQLLQEPEEKELERVIREKSKGILQAAQAKDYGKATQLFGDAFFEPVNNFFAKVMVNVEDTAIRNNRHALMKQIHQIYAGHVADLSVLSRIDQG